MTTPLNETATLRDLLFGDVPGTPIDALTESLREHDTVRALDPRLARTRCRRARSGQRDGRPALTEPRRPRGGRLAEV